MPRTIESSPAARSYAQALLDLATERNQQQAVGEEMQGLAQILRAEATFRDFLADPAIGEAERARVIETIFSGRVSPLLLDFLKLVNAKGRMGLLEQIVVAYDVLLDLQMGKVEVDVTVAHKLSDEQLESVRQGVSKALGRDATVQQKVDDSIIGGLVVRVGDRLIDASVRYQLQAMKDRMLAARPSAS